MIVFMVWIVVFYVKGAAQIITLCMIVSMVIIEPISAAIFTLDIGNIMI